MYKHLILIILSISLFACKENKSVHINLNPIQTDSIKNEIKADSGPNKTTNILDTLQYCILDTLPSGDVFYIRTASTDLEANPYNDTTTLFLYNLKNGELIDTIIIEGFYSIGLSSHPDCEWLDTCFILNDTTKAYAHTVLGSNPSHEIHIMKKTIDLIAVSPHSLQHVLSDNLLIQTCNRYNSDIENCEGSNKSFKTDFTETNGYYDIIVTNKTWNHKWEMKDDGEVLDSSSTVNSYLLKYENGKYEKEEKEE